MAWSPVAITRTTCAVSKSSAACATVVMGGDQADAARRPRATASRSDVTATAVGSPPAPRPVNDVVPPNVPVVRTTFCEPSIAANADPRGTIDGRTDADRPPRDRLALDT